MEDRNNFICKRYRLYTYLIERGFKPTGTLPDMYNPSYINWIFERSIEFDAAIDLYFKEFTKSKI